MGNHCCVKQLTQDPNEEFGSTRPKQEHHILKSTSEVADLIFLSTTKGLDQILDYSVQVSNKVSDKISPPKPPTKDNEMPIEQRDDDLSSSSLDLEIESSDCQHDSQSSYLDNHMDLLGQIEAHSDHNADKLVHHLEQTNILSDAFFQDQLVSNENVLLKELTLKETGKQIYDQFCAETLLQKSAIDTTEVYHSFIQVVTGKESSDDVFNEQNFEFLKPAQQIHILHLIKSMLTKKESQQSKVMQRVENPSIAQAISYLPKLNNMIWRNKFEPSHDNHVTSGKEWRELKGFVQVIRDLVSKESLSVDCNMTGSSQSFRDSPMNDEWKQPEIQSIGGIYTRLQENNGCSKDLNVDVDFAMPQLPAEQQTPTQYASGCQDYNEVSDKTMENEAVTTDLIGDKIGEYQELCEEKQARCYFQPEQIKQRPKTMNGGQKLDLMDVLLIQQRKKAQSCQNKIFKKSRSPDQIEETQSVQLKQDIGFKSFDVQEMLGQGGYGLVFKCTRKGHQEEYAMKVQSKKFLSETDNLDVAITECNVLKQLDHPYVTKMHYSFQTPNNLYMILDYCSGGDLFYHRNERKTFKEFEARFFIAEIFLAIEYIHSLNIIHRDLKPDNIIIDEEGHCRLSDFGLAEEDMEDDDLAMDYCGTPNYMPPEMIERQGVDKSADIYQIGTILYELLVGLPPFYSENLDEQQNNIKSAQLQFPENISLEAQDLMQLLMAKEPEERITIDKVKQHDFFRGMDWEKLARKEIEPPIHLTIESSANSEDLKEEMKSLKSMVTKSKDQDYTAENVSNNRLSQFTFIAKQDQWSAPQPPIE